MFESKPAKTKNAITIWLIITMIYSAKYYWEEMIWPNIFYMIKSFQ